MRRQNLVNTFHIDYGDHFNHCVVNSRIPITINSKYRILSFNPSIAIFANLGLFGILRQLQIQERG